MRAFFTADLGTSSLKAALIGIDGVEYAFSRVRYKESPALAASWLGAFQEASLSVIKGAPRLEISALCISANGPTFVPVNKNGDALRPLHWYDAPPPEAGSRSLFLPAVKKFMRERAADYEKTATLFSAEEWLSFMLGAERVTVIPNENYIPYYWAKEEAAPFSSLLPPFVTMGEVIGKTQTQFAADCAIPRNTPIAAGSADFIMALIGTGAFEEGVVCDRAGTSEGINVCTAKDTRFPALRTLPHAKSGLYNVGALIPESGSLFDAYRRRTGEERRDYKEHIEALLHGAAGSGTGREGRWTLLQIAHSVKEKIAVLQEAGFAIKEMRVSGGQAKNALWNGLKAKITGVTLLVPKITDGELAGDAALAAAALGEARDWEDAAKRLVQIERRFEPYSVEQLKKL